ncbi:hypothetical protein ACWC5I_00030 [Kitasatospora sp. NPDC001574]
MSVHFTTFVAPGAVLSQPHDIPFAVFGADSAEETADIPLPTSLHRLGNEVMPLVHASWGHPMPVTDLWARVVEEQYGRSAKVVVVLDPVPADISSEWAERTEGMFGLDLPPWLALLFARQLHAVIRDVPVTSGDGLASMGMVVGAPTALPAWAHQEIIPAGR